MPVTTGGTFVQIRQKHVTWREVDGIIIALDLSSSTYFTTNKTGKVLWNAMVGGATMDDLVSLLQSSFGIAADLAATDVNTFVELLATNNLLERAEQKDHSSGHR